MTSKLYYLQDTRSFTGNCIMFWAIAGGYTSDLRAATVFTEEEAKKQQAMRGTDKAWSKEYIDSKSAPTVDFQYVKNIEGRLV